MSYHCPKHGDQGKLVGIEVTFDCVPPVPEGLKNYNGLRRRYCWACWIDQMDATMCQLTEDAPANESQHDT